MDVPVEWLGTSHDDCVGGLLGSESPAQMGMGREACNFG